MTTAIRERGAWRRSFARWLKAVTAMGMPVWAQAVFASSQVVSTGWVRRTAPMLARTTLWL